MVKGVEERVRTDGGTTYRVRFRVDGRQQSESFDTLAGAQRWLGYLQAEGPARARRRLYAAERDDVAGMTVKAYAERHIDAQTGITDGTRETYRRYVRTLPPFLADEVAGEVTHVEISRWVEHMRAEGHGPKSVRNRHGFLAGVYAAGVARGEVPRNPCSATRFGTQGQSVGAGGVPEHLTPEEAAALVACTPAPYRLFVRAMLSTGMRFGEITALAPGAVTDSGKRVAVTRAWKVGERGQRYLGPPKNGRGRTVSLAGAVADDLGALAAARVGEELLFVTPRDAVIRQPQFLRDVWRPTVEEWRGQGWIKRPTPHTLRHTHATTLLLGGVPLHVVSRAMGHSDIRITSNRYGGINTAALDEAAEATARLFGG